MDADCVAYIQNTSNGKMSIPTSAFPGHAKFRPTPPERAARRDFYSQGVVINPRNPNLVTAPCCEQEDVSRINAVLREFRQAS